MITFLKGSILRVRGGFSKGDYVNFWWVELPRINSSTDKGNNMATNSEGYATKIILLCGPLRIIFFKGIKKFRLETFSEDLMFGWLLNEWPKEMQSNLCVQPLVCLQPVTSNHLSKKAERQILFSRPHHRCWGSLSCEWPLPVGNCWILAWGGYKMKLQEILINKAHFDFLRDAEKLWNNNLHQSSKGS